MMVKPTVKELLEHAENRFALVIATSRRARQIADGDKKLTDVLVFYHKLSELSENCTFSVIIPRRSSG